MELHLAIKKVVDELGVNIFTSNIFANVLADYGAYQDIPAIKQIIKDLVGQGHGENIISVANAKGTNGITKLDSIKSKFIKQNGYKDELVNYLFDCISYSIGLSSKEPSYKIKEQSQINHASGNKSIKDFNKELLNLQAEYINKLASLYESPDNESTALYGLYSAESLTELWLIEQKILIVNSALGINDNTWCEQQKKKFIDSRSKNRRLILHERLDNCKKDYITQLSSLITVPKNFIYTKSGYYSENAEKILKQKEDIISQLDASLRTTVLNDCLEEKKRTLEKHKQSFSKQLTQIVLKAVTPIAAVFVSLFFSINYMLSKDEIEQYKSTMLQAQNYITEQAYINAIATYDKAQTEYNGSFNTDGYKKEAIIKKEEACKLLFEQTNKLSKEYFSKGEYLNSRKELDSIKVYMLTPTLLTDYNREYENLIKQIESAIEKDKNTLILNIATNNGKLNAVGKKLLKQLLEICPEDYWLNIIQQKQK